MSLANEAYASMFFKSRTTLTIQEVAQKLCVDPKHVKNLILEGQLNGINISDRDSPRVHYRIPVEAYEEFLFARLHNQCGDSPLFSLPRPVLVNLYKRLKAHLEAETE